MQPLSGRQLLLAPEGQRAWNWQTLHSQIVLPLFPDDVVIWTDINQNNHQVRIMSRKDYSEYSFIEYTLVLDYINSGPPTP
jgi:hypothetical protein